MTDCRDELKGLLKEDRLAGATLLVFANKQDLSGSMTLAEIRDVSIAQAASSSWTHQLPVTRTQDYTVAQMAHKSLFSIYRRGVGGWDELGDQGSCRKAILVGPHSAYRGANVIWNFDTALEPDSSIHFNHSGSLMI